MIHVELLSDGLSAILLDTTAFHPVDTAWPDQPADHGTITTEAQGTQAIGNIARIDVDVAYRAALGNPAFDSLAIRTSRIGPHHSVDIYRIGKSLRRKGCIPTSLDDLDAVANQINAQLAQCVDAGGAVRRHHLVHCNRSRRCA